MELTPIAEIIQPILEQLPTPPSARPLPQPKAPGVQKAGPRTMRPQPRIWIPGIGLIPKCEPKDPREAFAEV